MKPFRPILAVLIIPVLFAACAAKTLPAPKAETPVVPPPAAIATEEPAVPVPVTVVPLAPAPPPPSIPAKPVKTGKVTIAAAGDVTLGNHFKDFDPELRNKRGYTDAQVNDYPFLHVREIFKRADLTVVNYEGTFTKAQVKTEKNFNFKADPWEVAKLKAGGVTGVSTANNHAYDFGPDGIRDTISTLEKAGIPHFGTGENLAEARKPGVFQANGLGVCFLGYLYLGDHSIEPNVLWATDSKPGMAGVGLVDDNLTKMRAMLSEDLKGLAARPDCDVRVVFFHWGREGTHELMPYQRELAQLAAGEGADFVLGSHPHVLQGLESLRGPAGDVPVIYSMGNFVFAGNWNPRNKDSVVMLATVELLPDGTRKRSLEPVPVYVDSFPENPFQPRPQPPDKALIVKEKLACWARETGIEKCGE